MNDSIFRISLDIHEHGSQAVLKVKKTDTGRKLYITLRSGGTPYIIEDDCYAVFKATKPDGSILYNACTIENNMIIYAFTEQTCTAVGKCRCEIALYGLDDKLITSPRFALLVDGTIYPDESVESTDEFSALTKQISDAMEATGAAAKAAQNAGEAAGVAGESADRANAATENANLATGAANQAAGNANEAAAAANRATENAKNASDNANKAAEEALTAAEGANKAAEDAQKATDNVKKVVDSIVTTKNLFTGADVVEGEYYKDPSGAVANEIYRYYKVRLLAGTYTVTPYCRYVYNKTAEKLAYEFTLYEPSTFTLTADGWYYITVAISAKDQKLFTSNYTEGDVESIGDYTLNEEKTKIPSIENIEKDIENLEGGISVMNDKITKNTGIYTARNMIDKNAVSPGYLYNGELRNNTAYAVTDYIEVQQNVKYVFSFLLGFYGGTNYYHALAAYNSNFEYVGNKADAGVIWDGEPIASGQYDGIGVISITNPDIKYIRVTLRADQVSEAMMVVGDTYPEKYQEYGYTLNNTFRLNDTEKAEVAKMLLGSTSPLNGKTAVFDGDSICDASADSLGGWAGRISANNAMQYHNYAVGGGTIVSIDGKYCIGGNIDTIHSAYPSLDYLILEGGTNDADRLGETGLGTFSATDYGGNYDTATFSGAFETLLYKAVSYYPTAKIGYIVAQKMGRNGGDAIRRAYFDRAVELCQKWGIPYIDLWHGSHLNTAIVSHWNPALSKEENVAAGSLYSDGQHLTSIGYEVITPKIEAWMKTL